MINLLRRRKLLDMMNVYADKMIMDGVSGADACVIHLLKVQTENNFEKKVRSLQTLLDLNQPEAITCTIKELQITSVKWPAARNSHKESEFLLRLLHEHLPRPEWGTKASVLS